MNESIKCFVINLDRCVERMKITTDILNNLNLKFERVAAIDANKMEDENWKKVSRKGYEICNGKSMHITEIGCYLSHVKALQQFLDSDYQFGLILEDDMEFNDDFNECLESVVKNNEHWDMVKFNGSHVRPKYMVRKKNMGKYSLVANFTRCTKAGAYIVNRKAAQSYVEKLTPIYTQIDHVLDRAWKFKIKVRLAFPLPARERREVSTIDYSAIQKTKKRFYNYKCLTKVLYRAYNEINRVFYFVSRGLFIPK